MFASTAKGARDVCLRYNNFLRLGPCLCRDVVSQCYIKSVSGLLSYTITIF